MANFGYQTTGASLDNPANNFIFCKSPTTPGFNGTLQSLTIVCQQLGANPATVDLALYSDSAGSPNARLTNASNTPGSAPASLGAVVIDVSALALAIATGVQYHFGIRVPTFAGLNNGDISVAFDTGAAGQGVYTASSIPPGTFPATFGGSSGSLGTEKWTVYATYVTSGGKAMIFGARRTRFFNRSRVF